MVAAAILSRWALGVHWEAGWYDRVPMDSRRAFARQFRWLTILRGTLVAGAAYDLAFAAVALVAPDLPARQLGLPQPGEWFYLWFMAVTLAMLGGLYLLAARDPRRYSGVIAVAIAGRLAGAAGFAAAALARPELAGLWALAGADAAFGLAHALAWFGYRGPVRG